MQLTMHYNTYRMHTNALQCVHNLSLQSNMLFPNQLSSIKKHFLKQSHMKLFHLRYRHAICVSVSFTVFVKIVRKCASVPWRSLNFSDSIEPCFMLQVSAENVALTRHKQYPARSLQLWAVSKNLMRGLFCPGASFAPLSPTCLTTCYIRSHEIFIFNLQKRKWMRLILRKKYYSWIT